MNQQDQEFESRLSLNATFFILICWILQLERSRFNSEHILRKLFIGDDTAGIQNIDQKGQPSHLGLPHVLLTFIGQDNLFGGVISSVS